MIIFIFIYKLFIMTAMLTYSVLKEIIDNYELKNIIIIRFIKDKLNDNCIDIIIKYLNVINKFKFPLLLSIDKELYEPLILLTNTLYSNPRKNISIKYNIYSRFKFDKNKLEEFYLVVKELLSKYYKCKNSIIFCNTQNDWNIHFSINNNKNKNYYDNYDIYYKNKNNRITFKFIYTVYDF